MEGLLDLLWLLLALPAFVVVVRQRYQGASLSQVLQAALVLTCIIVLLFPIISARDDVNALIRLDSLAETAADSGGPRKHVLPAQAIEPGALLLAIVFSALLSASGHFFRIADAAPSPLFPDCNRSWTDRAPPSPCA